MFSHACGAISGNPFVSHTVPSNKRIRAYCSFENSTIPSKTHAIHDIQSSPSLTHSHTLTHTHTHIHTSHSHTHTRTHTHTLTLTLTLAHTHTHSIHSHSLPLPLLCKLYLNRQIHNFNNSDSVPSQVNALNIFSAPSVFCRTCAIRTETMHTFCLRGFMQRRTSFSKGFGKIRKRRCSLQPRSDHWCRRCGRWARCGRRCGRQREGSTHWKQKRMVLWYFVFTSIHHRLGDHRLVIFLPRPSMKQPLGRKGFACGHGMGGQRKKRA